MSEPKWQAMDSAPKDGTHIWLKTQNDERWGCWLVNCWGTPCLNWAVLGKSTRGMAFNDQYQPLLWRELTQDDCEADRKNYHRTYADAMQHMGTGKIH